MSAKPLYVFREQDATFLKIFLTSVDRKNEQNRTLVFHLYGEGGVGKTYLLRHIQHSLSDKACVLYNSFDSKIGVETPIQLMKNLHKDLEEHFPQSNILPKELFLRSDSFHVLTKRYESAINQLKVQPLKGKPSVDSEQLSTVNQLVRQASNAPLFGGESVTNEERNGSSDIGLENASMILSEKDRIQQFLQKHHVTKSKKKLQNLLQNPLLELTHSFTQNLIKKSEKRPIILILDTYEKTGEEFDLWVLFMLIKFLPLKVKHNVYIVIAGRFSLMEKEKWRKFQQDNEIMFSIRLDRFNLDETQRYLRQISGSDTSIEVNTFFQKTKGLPYYLSWIRNEFNSGRKIDFSAGDEIVSRLILNSTYSREQKTIIQIAACCRWFNRDMIRYLAQYFEIYFQQQDTNFEPDYFHWLKKQSFAEFYNHSYRLNDVARDVIRRSLWQDNWKHFRDINKAISTYFEHQAQNLIGTSTTGISQGFESDDWCRAMAECLYYLAFSDDKGAHVSYINLWIGSCYFNQDEFFLQAIDMIHVDCRDDKRLLLSQRMHLFLSDIKSMSAIISDILADNIVDIENYLESKSIPIKKHDIYQKLSSHCFSRVDKLDNSIKVIAYFIQLRFCLSSQIQVIIHQLEKVIREIEEDNKTLTVRLYRDGMGTFCYKSGLKDQAIQFYKKAVSVKFDDVLSLNNLGYVISEVEGHNEEALSYLNQAVELDPNNRRAWSNRGYVLDKMKRHQEAIFSFEKALLNDQNSGNSWKTWFNRGNSLRHLMQYAEAVESYKKALATHSECCDIWNNLGLTLAAIEDYEQALKSYEKAIFLDTVNPLPHYNKACCYSLKGDVDLALHSLKKAIALSPEQFKNILEFDRDLDNIRNEYQFLEIYQGLKGEVDHTISPTLTA